MQTEIVQLVRPTPLLKDSYLEALVEFQQEGLKWMMHLDRFELAKDFEAFAIKELNKWTHWTKDTPVQETEYWAVLNNEYAGNISVRHELNADLRIMGGNIGYDTRPKFRGRGVATSMLRQILPIAKEIGLTEALLTCNDDNLHSIRVIEKNGGVLRERKLQYPGGPMKRYYWINLK